MGGDSRDHRSSEAFPAGTSRTAVSLQLLRQVHCCHSSVLPNLFMFRETHYKGSGSVASVLSGNFFTAKTTTHKVLCSENRWCILFSCRTPRLLPESFLHEGPGSESASAKPPHHGAAVQAPTQVSSSQSLNQETVGGHVSPLNIHGTVVFKT